MMFWGWIPPGLNLSETHARGRGGLQPGAFRDCRPPWGGCPQSRARWSSLGFGAAWPAQTTFFLISRVKPVFTKRRRLGDEKSLFVRRFVACFFAGPERNWRCRRGKSPPPRKPGRPAAARPTTATGSRFLRRQRERPPRRPRPSPPAREGSLGAPNDRTFSEGAFRKARKGKANERRKLECHAHRRPRTTAPPEDGWEGSQPKRAGSVGFTKRRGKPAK